MIMIMIMMIISIGKGRKKEEKKERCSNVLIDSYSRGLLRKEVIKKREREREREDGLIS
jgi:hypothetical protein